MAGTSFSSSPKTRSMIACFDVHYRADFAQVAAVLFADWTDAEPHRTYVLQTPLAGEYEPGQFYKRELPVLEAMLAQIEEDLSYLLVDSYVMLAADRPGLGAYLWESLDRKIPVIGVAKTHFRAAEAVEAALLRGDSSKPLYITTLGCDRDWAVERVREMAGPYRLPSLIKLADQLSKD